MARKGKTRKGFGLYGLCAKAQVPLSALRELRMRVKSPVRVRQGKASSSDSLSQQWTSVFRNLLI